MKALIEVLNKVSDNIPVRWDRWTKSNQENPYYSVYGWIKRTDGNSDFVVIEMWEDSKPEEAYFVTSSAKWSSKICEIISGQTTEHNPCRKISELLSACP